jgi:hypothetical protein
MKTTIELPDELIKEIKLLAVGEGLPGRGTGTCLSPGWSERGVA